MASQEIAPIFSEDAIALECVQRMDGKVRFFRDTWYFVSDDGSVSPNDLQVRRAVREICREISGRVTEFGGSLGLARKIASEATYRHVMALVADDPRVEMSEAEERVIAVYQHHYLMGEADKDSVN